MVIKMNGVEREVVVNKMLMNLLKNLNDYYINNAWKTKLKFEDLNSGQISGKSGTLIASLSNSYISICLFYLYKLF